MKKSNNQKWAFIAIIAVFMVVFFEFAFRLTLWSSKKFPFWRPDLAISERYYPELKLLNNTHITTSNDSLDILILGGSVVADEWRSKVAKDLRDSLKIALKTDKVRYFNMANLGHTTVDNLYKYRMMPDKRFDLVVYYEGINETRFNNVPTRLFRDDYTHVRWYHDIELVKQHSEMRYTVIPFIMDMIGHYASVMVGNRYLMDDNPDSKYYAEGENIKTAPIYQKNLKQIIEVARKRNEPFVLINYTYYIPDRWRKSNFQDNEWDFSACDLASPIRTWGTAPNVEKGILAHRAMMAQLAQSNPDIHYFDIHGVFPKEGQYFCDICHLTPAKGCRVFANELAGFVLKNNVLKKRY